MSSSRNWQGGRDNGARLPPMFEAQEFPWWMFEERTMTRPSGLMRPIIYDSTIYNFPRRLMDRRSMQVFESPPRFADQMTMQVPTQQVESRLTQEEQKKALQKLKTEIYNPMPKMISKRLNFYYRDNSRTSNNEKELKGNDEDGKRCAICLEDFEPREQVMITPCNHMFHEDCIVPWVKSHGQCPVCRFALCEQIRESTLPLNNNPTNMDTTDLVAGQLLDIVRAFTVNR